jgi:hypothetical protein
VLDNSIPLNSRREVQKVKLFRWDETPARGTATALLVESQATKGVGFQSCEGGFAVRSLSTSGSVPILVESRVVPPYCSVDPGKDSHCTTEDTTHAKSTKVHGS